MNNNTWIKHTPGKKNPCKFWDRIKIKMRCGMENEGDSNCFNWGVFPEYPESEIVEYMIIEKEKDRENIL